MTNLKLGPVYLGNLDLADAYIWLFFLLKGNLSVVFLIPRKKPVNDQLVGFHLSLPMVYMDAFAISAIVSIDMHKYGALSMYTIGRDRWKPTN